MLTHRPRKGSYIKWPGEEPYEVLDAQPGGICWIRSTRTNLTTCFIWRFKDGLNRQAVHCDADGNELKDEEVSP